jgi:hypothetical protein
VAGISIAQAGPAPSRVVTASSPCVLTIGTPKPGLHKTTVAIGTVRCYRTIRRFVDLRIFTAGSGSADATFTSGLPNELLEARRAYRYPLREDCRNISKQAKTVWMRLRLELPASSGGRAVGGVTSPKVSRRQACGS